jgi:hypothetical protein
MSSALQLPRERVQSLDPANIEAYLVAHGWQMDPEVSSAEAGIYHLPSDRNVEIIVPRDKGFVDYALRVGEVLREVAVAERRKAWEVLEDLAPKPGNASANGPAVTRREARNATRRGKPRAP